MDASNQDQPATRDADLADWRTFSLAYYELIQRTLRLLRVPDAKVVELAHAFLIKAAEKDFLDTYRAFQRREQEAGRRARFRTYLYRSLHNHVTDDRRKAARTPEQGLSPEVAESLVADAARPLDPDALYAIDILHQALQALRRHCERTGKPHLWVVFEELLLADEFRGRAAKTREQLLALFPGKDPQFLDNCLTTAKRAFRRLVQEVIPYDLRKDVSSAERFRDWMEILRQSNASQYNKLHVAYRVSPLLVADASRTSFPGMVLDDRSMDACYEEPALTPDDDELSLLIGLRLDLPLCETLEAAELQQFIPPGSPFAPLRRPGPRTGPGVPHQVRSLTLLTLVNPTTPDETTALGGIDLVGILGRLKSFAKRLRDSPDHAMPEIFAQLLYTLVNVLALVRRRAELYTIGPEALARNIRWFLRRPWLDDRLRPLLHEGLALLDDPPKPGPAPEA
jgi:DNA-directed RNA polymerase specialized sigma24 family protein